MLNMRRCGTELPAWLSEDTARRVLCFLVPAIWMLPAARALLLNRLAPFAPAVFAAGMAAGWNPFAMLAGCLVALPLGYTGPESLSTLLSCLCVYGAWLISRLIVPGDSSRPHGGDLRMVVCAGLGALLSGVALSQGLFYNGLAAAASALIAAAAAPALFAAVSLAPGRSRLMPDERVSLALYAGVVILGSAYLPGLASFTPVALASFTTLLLSGGGASRGALAGALSGLALRACGFDGQFCALLSLCGACAGVASSLGRPASALTMLVTVMLSSGWSQGMDTLLPMSVCASIAGVVVCLLPERFVALIAVDLDSDRAESDRRASERLRADTRKRLGALAEVFDELSSGYAPEDCGMPDERTMTCSLRDRLCAACPGYAQCWGDGNGVAGRLLCQLLGMAFSGSIPGEDMEIPPEIGRVCRRASLIPRRLGPLLAEYDARRRAELKRRRLTTLMSAQFRQARDILMDAADDVCADARVDSRLADVARSALEREGVRAESVYALAARGSEICCGLTAGGADEAALARAAKRIGEEMGGRYVVSAGSGSEARIVTAPRRTLKAGSKGVAGDPSGRNGDSRAAMRLSDGRALLALSDGMGSGERAARESAETLRLLAKFLQAGMEPGAALDAINELMLLRGGDDMFATVDLCVIDPLSGTADFYKLGACRSYLLRGGACVRLEGGKLPLGILEEVRPVRRSLPLRAGDMLVMATDGLEGDDGDEWIVEALRGMGDIAPQEACERLIQQTVARRRDGCHVDDATVIAVRVA